MALQKTQDKELVQFRTTHEASYACPLEVLQGGELQLPMFGLGNQLSDFLTKYLVVEVGIFL